MDSLRRALERAPSDFEIDEGCWCCRFSSSAWRVEGGNTVECLHAVVVSSLDEGEKAERDLFDLCRHYDRKIPNFSL